jgi:hypothetical protein
MTRPGAWVIIGANGQYRITIEYSPLDSTATLAEAEALLRQYGQSEYQTMRDGEEITVPL